jgi:2-dehydro-3-deoxyphosphooctonate aldolase (KDO 8-P synthase)
MPSPRIRIADGVVAGGGAPLLLIAGPDSIESEAHALRMAQALKGIAGARHLTLVFKSSFDKANRTSLKSFRGPRGCDRSTRRPVLSPTTTRRRR